MLKDNDGFNFKGSSKEHLLGLLKEEKRTREAGYKFLSNKNLSELKKEIKRRKNVGEIRKDAGLKRKIKNKLTPSFDELMKNY